MNKIVTSPTRRATGLAALVLLAGLGLSACNSSSDTAAKNTATASAEATQSAVASATGAAPAAASSAATSSASATVKAPNAAQVAKASQAADAIAKAPIDDVQKMVASLATTAPELKTIDGANAKNLVSGICSGATMGVDVITVTKQAVQLSVGSEKQISDAAAKTISDSVVAKYCAK